ncbi:TPA: hNH endonuclease [Salmonella enterica subsp. diarizonae serovar 61:r:z53]
MKTDTDELTMNQLAERNAEHVTTIAALESRCASLSAKLSMINYLMEAAEQANTLAQEAAEKLVQECNALATENAAMKSAKEIIRHLNANREEANFCGIDDCHIDDAVEAMLTPATDAFLAEVRAQGVEMFAASLKVVGGHGHPYSAVANEFAAQLRKGGAA